MSYRNRIADFFKSIIVIVSQKLSSVSSRLREKEQREVDYIAERKLVGNIIISVLTERIDVRRGLTLFPKGCEDPSVRSAWHALCHYEADEDIKAQDIEFNNQQVELLEMIAFTFKDGEPLPQNIIDAYEPYYKDNPVSYENSFWGFVKKFLRILNF